jgi:hypothetical protein
MGAVGSRPSVPSTSSSVNAIAHGRMWIMRIIAAGNHASISAAIAPASHAGSGSRGRIQPMRRAAAGERDALDDAVLEVLRELGPPAPTPTGDGATSLHGGVTGAWSSHHASGDSDARAAATVISDGPGSVGPGSSAVTDRTTLAGSATACSIARISAPTVRPPNAPRP